MGIRFKVDLMNPRTLLHLIPFISEGRHSSTDLAAKSGLGETVTEELLTYLAASGVGRLEYGGVTFSGRDRVLSAVTALQAGCSVDEVSSRVGWRDFEDIVSEILAAYGFTVKRGFRLRKPRMEIDVLAFKGNVCLAIDCKQWRRTAGESVMKRVAEKQMMRSERLARSGEEEAVERGFQHIYPVITTLYEEAVKIVEGVAVVPVTKLTGFLQEFEGYRGVLKDVCA